MPTTPMQPADLAAATEAIPAIVTDNGETIIKRGRLKTAQDLANSYQSLFNEDLESSRQRAKVDAALSGAAPYDPQKERKLGIHGRSNINWGVLAQPVEEAQMPFFRFLESVDNLCITPLKEDYLEAEVRMSYEQIIAEEISRTIKNWPSFLPNWGQLTLLYVLDAVGFTFFSDNIDWRWQVRGLQHLKFPRDVTADVDYLDIVTLTLNMRPDELLKKVRAQKDLPEGEVRYWNEEAIDKAVLDTARSWARNTNNPETIIESWKNNDLTLGMTAITVPVIHGFVREADGTVSHYIGRYDGEGDFLYACEGKFQEISQLMTAFIGNVGTNGDFHSIRGLGYKLFTPTTGFNRLLNKYLDQACSAATPHLSTSNEDANTGQAITPMGPYNVMAEGTEFIDMPEIDFSKNMVPAIGMMTNLIASRSASSAPVAAAQANRTQKTKYQVQQESEQEGALQSANFSLFMASWQRHLREVVRRLCRSDYQMSDPGGKEAWDLRKRLLRRGVPLKALNHVDIDAIEANSGLGKGSTIERRAVVDALSERLMPYLDEKGKQLLLRSTAAAYAGIQVAKLLVPDQPGMRPPVDAQIAQMENNQMIIGLPPSFTVNQDHVVHVGEHLSRLAQINGQLTQLTIDLRSGIDAMQPIWEHCINDHMTFINPQNPVYKKFKEGLQQLGEVITNGRKKLDAQDQKAAEEAQQAQMEGTGQYGDQDPGQFAAAVDAQARLAEMGKAAASTEQIRAQTQIALQKHQQDMAAKDVELMLRVQDQKLKEKTATQKNGQKAPTKP